MSKPSAIIFDYGFVIVGPLDRAAFEADLNALAREHGFEHGRDLWNHFYVSEAWEQAKRGRISHEDFWAERLAALGITDEAGRTAFKARLYRHWGVLPAMRALLDALHGRYRLAILSNTSRRNFAQYISERRGLKGIFDVVLSSAEEGVAKPEAAFYRLALAQLGVRPEQVLFIDDQRRNTEAAEALGIPSIVFTTPEDLREELQRRGIL